LFLGDCVSEKKFIPEHCECRCRDVVKHLMCKESNLEWDSSRCECRCPSNQLLIYLSGGHYICSSVMTASLGLITIGALLFVCISISVVGFIIHYRKMRRPQERAFNESQGDLLNKDDWNQAVSPTRSLLRTLSLKPVPKAKVRTNCDLAFTNEIAEDKWIYNIDIQSILVVFSYLKY